MASTIHQSNLRSSGVEAGILTVKLVPGMISVTAKGDVVV